MAAHSLSKDYVAGWHLIGPPLTPWEKDLVENFNAGFSHASDPSLPVAWGQDWVSYDATGTYDNLYLNLGQGYYTALASDMMLTQLGAPIVADPDCHQCLDRQFHALDNPERT